MEALLLAIYSFFVWLIFFKFKWLPWNTASMVIVITIPIVGMAAMILLLNVVAPSSSDVRVVKYVINVVPQVKGRVIEVPVEPNRPVQKGAVLFRIDPTPYQAQVDVLRAQLVNARGTANRLGEGLKASVSRSGVVRAKLELARLRVKENRALVASNAGDRFAFEEAEAAEKQLQAELAGAIANEGEVRAQLNATVDGDPAEVAQIKAQLANAEWDLSQTTVLAPTDGYAINVQLRRGSMTAAVPIAPAMTFVENEYRVYGLFQQNELHQVEPGNEAEFTLATHPGLIVKATVDSVVWAQSQGQIALSTQLPETGAVPSAPGRFAVKFAVDPRQADLFFPAGAIGQGAIYTNHLHMLHVIRKVMLRVGTKLDYLVLKLH